MTQKCRVMKSWCYCCWLCHYSVIRLMFVLAWSCHYYHRHSHHLTPWQHRWGWKYLINIQIFDVNVSYIGNLGPPGGIWWPAWPVRSYIIVVSNVYLHYSKKCKPVSKASVCCINYNLFSDVCYYLSYLLPLPGLGNKYLQN